MKTPRGRLFNKPPQESSNLHQLLQDIGTEDFTVESLKRPLSMVILSCVEVPSTGIEIDSDFDINRFSISDIWSEELQDSLRGMATDSSYTPHVEDEDSEIQSKKRAKELQEKIDRIEGHLEDKRKQLEFLKAMGAQPGKPSAPPPPKTLFARAQSNK